jgi:hypothetical protein
MAGEFMAGQLTIGEAAGHAGKEIGRNPMQAPRAEVECHPGHPRAGAFDLTIVVPTLEISKLALPHWRDLAESPFVRELLVVLPSGAPPSVSFPAGVRRLEAPLGRASQMNAGAVAARSEFLLFLHGDTIVAPSALGPLWRALRQTTGVAFAFSLAYRSSKKGLRLLAWLARARDRVSPFPLGDQGLAMRRSQFFEMGGFDDEPLFEDWLMIKRLRRTRRLRVLPELARTGPERFERNGILRNLARNTLLVFLQILGVSPRTLVRLYYGSEYLDLWLAADPARRGGQAPQVSRLPELSPD